jgi:MFS family permease
MIGEGGLLTFVASTNTFLQTHVEESMRGRVIIYYVMAFGGMIPIGSLIIGLLAHFTSAPFALLMEVLAGIIAIVSFIPAFKKTAERAEEKATQLKMATGK